MATTLIVNPGSTSHKYALYKKGSAIYVIVFEETGNGFRMVVTKHGATLTDEVVTATQFSQSLQHTLAFLQRTHCIADVQDITAVGVRIVAPGTLFTKHQHIDEVFVAALQKQEILAPLHIPTQLTEIAACQKLLPHATLVAISDSAFHRTIATAQRAISVTAYDAHYYDLSRFGYHGLSITSIVQQLPAWFDSVPGRVIVCHIGGGVSVTALRNGQSIANSMGYSPASGIIMGSRGGDIAADALAALMVQKRLDADEIYSYLYHETGFMGVAGIRDFRLVLDRAAGGVAEAQQAVAMFQSQVQAFIGAYTVLLGGLDAIVLTGTASVRNPFVRTLLLENLSVLGVALDDARNEMLVGKAGLIHARDSRVQLCILQTDEMSEMQRIVTTFVTSSVAIRHF